MLAWLLLIPAFAFFMIGSYATYNDAFRRSYHFAPVFLSMNFLCGLVWLYASRILDDKTKLFIYSMFWDALMMFCYYVLPLLFGGIRPNYGIIIGSILVVGGLSVVHFYGN